MTDTRECNVRVRGDGRWGAINRRPCGKEATLEHEGKWYCKLHHPPTIKNKRDARAEAYKKRISKEVSAAAERRTAAAEVQRKAIAYDRLVDRLVGKREYDTLCVADIREVLEAK